MGYFCLLCAPVFFLGKPQNECPNLIFRRNVSKGISIDFFTAENILYFTDEMSTMPRKSLDYTAPEELIDEFLEQVYSVI